MIVQVHGHFPKHIYLVWIIEYQGSQSVPQIVKCIKPFSSEGSGLILGLDEGASQFNHMGNIIAYKLIRKVEELGSGQSNLPVLNTFVGFTDKKAVSAQNGLFIRIPDN